MTIATRTAAVLAVLSVCALFLTQVQDNQLLLSSVKSVPSDLTIEQWMVCQNQLPKAQQACQTTDEYYTASSAFSALTYIDSPTVNQECKNFDAFWNKAWASNSLNQDDLYSNCYLSQQIQTIAASNACFFDNYYSPIYLQCAGVTEAKTVDNKSTTSSSVSFIDWATCYANIHLTTDDCQTTDDYNSVASKVYALTHSDSATHLSQCQDYFSYFIKAGAESPINYNNYFSECFLNSSVLAIAKSNTCFYEKHYAPLFIKCAGL